MKALLIAAVGVIVLAITQMASPAIAQSISQRTTIGDGGGGSVSPGSRQLSLLCHAHRQRLRDWEQGGRAGRISSPTSALAVYPDDSTARYAAEIGQLCAGAPEPDSAILAQFQADREAIRTSFDNVQPQTSTEGSTQAWSNLPRRQAQGGADVFDNAVNQQGSNKEAREQLAQQIAELSAQAIDQQSRSIDYSSLLIGFLGVLGTQDAGSRQLALQQLMQQTQQARAYAEGRDLGPSYSEGDTDTANTAGSDGAGGGGTSERGQLSNMSCEAMKQVVIGTKVPPNASVTAAMETVMFMTKTALNMIDAGCPTEPGVTRAQIVAARAEYQQQFTIAEQNCNTVQSGGRRCVPQVHNATGVSATAHRQPANNGSASGQSADPCIELNQLTPTGCPPRRSSIDSRRGGIRTAN